MDALRLALRLPKNINYHFLCCNAIFMLQRSIAIMPVQLIKMFRINP